MTHVGVYDDTAKAIERATEKLDISEAELIDMLVDGYLDELLRTWMSLKED